MHFYLVCNMNKIGLGSVVCVFILVTTGAAEFVTKYKTITTTTKWKEPTTLSWQETTATPVSKLVTTTTKDNLTASSLKSSTATADRKETFTTKQYKEPTSTNKWKTPTTTAKTTSLGKLHSKAPGVVAVAGFSTTDSRYGRVSPMNGIKVYPDPSLVKTDAKGNFILKTVNGKLPTPITITKQGDGVSGTIRIQPGSVSVSSSASSSPNSGPVSAYASYNPWKTSYFTPNANNIYFHPFSSFPTLPDPIYNRRSDIPLHTKFLEPFSYTKFPAPVFDSHIQDPWLSKDIFKQPQPRYNTFSSNWFYPSFNPFYNYW